MAIEKRLMKKLFFIAFIIAAYLLPCQIYGQDSNQWRKLTNLTVIYFNAGKYAEALKLTKESLALEGQKDNELSLANLAIIYNALNDKKSSEEIIKSIKEKRAKLETDLKEQQLQYRLKKMASGITGGSIPLGSVSENAFDLIDLKRSISCYAQYEDNIKAGKIMTSSTGASFEPNYSPPEIRTEKENYDSGELWKEYTYTDSELTAFKEFDKNGTLIFSGSID